MGFHKALDYFAWAREMDVVSTDNYPEGMRRIYDAVPALRGAIRPATPGGDGVERVTRSAPGQDYEFLINHADTDRTVTLPGPGYDVLSGRRTNGAMTLGRQGVAIVRRDG